MFVLRTSCYVVIYCLSVYGWFHNMHEKECNGSAFCLFSLRNSLRIWGTKMLSITICWLLCPIGSWLTLSSCIPHRCPSTVYHINQPSSDGLLHMVESLKVLQLVRCIIFTITALSSVIQSLSRVCIFWTAKDTSLLFFSLNTHFETIVVQNSEFMSRMFGRLCTSINIMRNHSLSAKLHTMPLLTIEFDVCWRWKIYSFGEVRYCLLTYKVWCQIIFLQFFDWPTCLILCLFDYFQTLILNHFFGVNVIISCHCWWIDSPLFLS